MAIQSMQSLQCCVRGTSVVKGSGFFSSLQVLYHIKVKLQNQSWVQEHSMEEVLQLHTKLLYIASHPKHKSDDLHKALVCLPCPKEPLFKKTEMLVIKGMCGELEHYLINLVKLCQRFQDSPDAERVEECTLAFLLGKQ
ncbi:hypothetical protein THRCLA_20775 [Thraustotheca clavata]|uniref:PX domain-containing protein n=1 Tax=Thraustotheca clavata TaxID=74557 RepID=A0A1W0A3U3_9STRA|nr:hypothetical protein THRCLA_20775 [Thraustotheca clavata]